MCGRDGILLEVGRSIIGCPAVARSTLGLAGATVDAVGSIAAGEIGCGAFGLATIG